MVDVPLTGRLHHDEATSRLERLSQRRKCRRKLRAIDIVKRVVRDDDVERLGGQADRPSVIICHTIKGKGVPFVENNLNWHHKSKVADEEVRDLLAALEAP